MKSETKKGPVIRLFLFVVDRSLRADRRFAALVQIVYYMGYIQNINAAASVGIACLDRIRRLPALVKVTDNKGDIENIDIGTTVGIATYILRIGDILDRKRNLH